MSSGATGNIPAFRTCNVDEDDCVAQLRRSSQCVRHSASRRELSDPIPRIARAWAELIRRLGYHRYIAQGGDFDAIVSHALAAANAEHVAGAHVNFLPTAPSVIPPN